MTVAAIFPGILPEHGLEEIKTTICSNQLLLLASENEIMMDWSDEGVGGVKSGNFATLYANKATRNLLRSVCDIPMRLPNATVQPISINEVHDGYHAEAIARHTSRMRECRVILIKGLPKWANVEDTFIIPPVILNSNTPANMSIGKYVRSMGSDGLVNEEGDQIFKEMLNGNQPTKMVITVPEGKLDQALTLIPVIQGKIQECVPEEYVIMGNIWPQIHDGTQHRDQGCVIESYQTADRDQKPRMNEEIVLEDHDATRPVEEESSNRDGYQQSSEEMSEAQKGERLPTDPQVQHAAEATQQELNAASSDDNDTLFTRVQPRAENVSSQEIIALMTNMNVTAEKLTAAVEKLNSRLQSATAPLTTIMTKGTNSQGASTSLSTETTQEIIMQALLKVLNEACLPGGCLHPTMQEQGRPKLVPLTDEELERVISVIKDAVDYSVYDSIPTIQEEVRNELRDSQAVMRKLISAPARELSGEMAMAVDTLLSPKFDTMSNMIKRLAIMAETTTSSPPHSALGGPETTPVYKVLTSILLAVRENQYQMSKGYDLMNSMYQDMQTAIARECRRDGEREAHLRGYFRSTNALRRTFLVGRPEDLNESTAATVMDYLEMSHALQARLKMHFEENGVSIPDGDDSPSSTKNPTVSRKDEQEKEEANEHCQRKEEEEWNETAQQMPRRKDPPENLVLEAECVRVENQIEEPISDEEEAQIELAKALSVMEQAPEGKPPALSEEEYGKRKLLAQEQESLEQEMKQQAVQEMEKKLGQVEIDFSPQGPLTPLKEQDGEEEVPGTPTQAKNPMIVTPKEYPKIREEIVCDDDREMSNLTAPSVVFAGASSEASHASDVSTVVSDGGNSAEQLAPAPASGEDEDQSAPPSGSMTREALPRSCKKTRSTQ